LVTLSKVLLKKIGIIVNEKYFWRASDTSVSDGFRQPQTTDNPDSELIINFNYHSFAEKII